MTHPRTTTASAQTGAADGPRPLDDADDRRRLADGEGQGDADDRESGDRRPTDARAERARVEPMTVRPLRDGRYVVETEGGTYVVDLDGRSCTCPDHAIRGARCKHLRRVAMEVTAGRLPAPNERTSACAVCGERLFVPMTAAGPRLCPRHERTSGDVVRDRETGGLLVVVGTTTERADEHRTGEGRLVADYPTNDDYGGHEPVVLAVYLASVDGDENPRRYAFPASRLVPVEPGVAARVSVPADDGTE